MLGTPSLIVISTLKNLNDQPSHRKLHSFSKPRLGGVVLFFGMILSYLLFKPTHFNETQYLLAALLVTFATGFKDDIIGVDALKKLAINIFIAAIIIFGMGLKISDLGGVFGIHEVSDWISIPLTFFAVIVILNAYNLVDGVDGLASSIALISSAFYVTCLLKSGNGFEVGYMGVGLIGGLIAFLMYNIAPSKIFLGDSGSLILGAVNVMLFLQFISPEVLGKQVYVFEFTPQFAIAAMIFPLTDVLRVFTLRILKGRSPFSADKNHIHHKLLESGLNEKLVGLSLVLVTVFFIGLAVILRDVNTTISLLIMVVLALLFAYVPVLIAKKNNK
jgi:UDP-N-acetylmuramyl pentapeptide phosphotransferase/UDP-N-acetylglucosamine-1-phosphate transferase